MIASRLLLQEYPMLLAQWPSLSGIYTFSLIVGGGLLLVSTLLGGDSDTDVDTDFDADFDADIDIDADVDIDAEIDADVDADAEVDVAAGHGGAGFSLASWISLRFIVYFLAMFGLVGTVLSYMSGLSHAIILTCSLGGGIVVGQIAHQLFRYLKRSSVDSAAAIKDFINQPARVTIAVRPPACGEIAVHVGDSERFVRAVAKRKEDRFDVNQSVGVVGFQNGTAVIVGKEEFEFLNAS